MIVLDTSAIMAILLEENEAESCRNRLLEAGGAWVSAGTAIELSVVSSRDGELFAEAQKFLREPYIHIEAVDESQVALAAEGYRRYGKGHHPAGLNLGDVFAYALTRRRDAPLLFKGGDFGRTDIVPA